jgi:hypothetical protein
MCNTESLFVSSLSLVAKWTPTMFYLTCWRLMSNTVTHQANFVLPSVCWRWLLCVGDSLRRVKMPSMHFCGHAWDERACIFHLLSPIYIYLFVIMTVGPHHIMFISVSPRWGRWRQIRLNGEVLVTRRQGNQQRRMRSRRRGARGQPKDNVQQGKVARSNATASTRD